jgi:hypothetical protein
VIWTLGNHELWTYPSDPALPRGVEKYEQLVRMCRQIDAHTPEDDYLVWDGDGGPVIVAPLFLLYDYSFWAPGGDHQG